MLSLLDKLGYGILAFETEQGIVYVRPARRERLHLLWTFRNFNGLPIKLLTAREQKLVEALYRTPSANLSGEPDRDLLIGTVEDFRLLPATLALPPIELSPVEKGVEKKYEAPAPIVAAVIEHHPRRRRKKKRRKEVLTRETPSKPVNSVPRRGLWSNGRLLFAASALCAVMGVLFWYRTQTQLSSAAASGPIAEGPTIQNTTATLDATPSSAPASSGIRTPEDSPVPGNAAVRERTRIAEAALTQNAKITPVLNSSASKNTNAPANRHKLAEPAAHEAQERIARVQVSRPPHHIVYPDYPAVHARGNVALKAVVSADGTVRHVEILSGNQMLAAAAVRAIRQWHYSPYYQGGQAIETETNIRVTFVAADAISVSFPAPAELAR